MARPREVQRHRDVQPLVAVVTLLILSTMAVTAAAALFIGFGSPPLAAAVLLRATGSMVKLTKALR
jgi:hypothetical protein